MICVARDREKNMAVHHVYVGAVKSAEGGKGGVFRRAPGADQRWEALSDGLPAGTDIHAITVDRRDPDTVMIATTKGAFRSRNRGDHWQRLALPEEGTDIWSITVHPSDPKTIYAGYGPVGVYRSDDGGERWTKLPDPGLPDRVHMTFACRVMRFDVEPSRPDEVYACIEANGAMRSRDRGEHWEDLALDLVRFAEQEKYKSRIVSQTEIEGMLDGHALACSAAAPGSVFLANRMGLFRSDDQGGHWQDTEVGRYSPMTYGRDLRVSPHNPKVLYAALSPAFRSGGGAVYRSDDVGKSWKRFDRGVKADNTMMGVAPHPRDPRQVYAVSKSGQVFGTADGGDSWSESRLPQGTGDCYAVACG